MKRTKCAPGLSYNREMLRLRGADATPIPSTSSLPVGFFPGGGPGPPHVPHGTWGRWAPEAGILEERTTNAAMWR